MSGFPSMHQWEALHNQINENRAQMSGALRHLKAEVKKCRALRNRAEKMSNSRLADELEIIWADKLINNSGYKTDIIITEILHRLRLTEFSQLLIPTGSTPFSIPGKGEEGEDEQGKKHILNPYFVFDADPTYGMVLVFHYTAREARYLGFQQWPVAGLDYIWFRALRAHDEYNRLMAHNQPHVIDSYDSNAETWLEALNEQFRLNLKSSYKNF